MKKAKFISASMALLFIGAISPAWIGITYMYITGHGKGYSYNMGSESDFSVMSGVFLLFLWLIFVSPVLIWLSVNLYRLKKYLVFIPALAFSVIFAAGVLIMGWDEFIAFFGIGFNRFTR